MTFSVLRHPKTVCPSEDSNLDMVLRRDPLYPVELPGRSEDRNGSSLTFRLRTEGRVATL